ncbi:MAG: IS30 family transposase [Candidatus Thiodiazotropha sp. (ex Lucinoma kastoroae)]|nr:IS30 family transposase [Candidatus Thiodiazotropha sp. (ex Lucinoma kastoroae)]
MGAQYSHLSLSERQSIFYWYHYQKKSVREVGRLIGRSHTTISRELRRNIYDYYVPTYYPHPAQSYYKSRMRQRCQREPLKSEETRKYVKDKLSKGWTPEIISGRLELEPSLVKVSHEAIYQYIYKHAPELITHLARHHKRRRKKYPYRKNKAKVIDKTSIIDRPEVVNERIEIGHWESDSIESKGRSCAVNVLLERVTRLVQITKLPSKKSVDTLHAIEKRLSQHPDHFIKSITYDNGTENAKHLQVNNTLSCESYFCQPYHSWEKGAVEQINGLIRRYFPKGTDFKAIHYTKIKEVEEALNNRPRKCLNYKTPLEVYNEKCGAL